MKLLIIILVVTAAIVIQSVARNPAHKGMIGEKKVSSILASLPNEYQVLNNVIIPNQRATAQIDHVVVSPFGIFVIETKNFEGWIFGAENSEKWKETFKTTGGDFFRNPIKQNWGHVCALAEYLNLDKRVFKPVVVFSNKARLKVESSSPVIHMSQLKKLILSYSQEIIPSQDAALLFNRLSKANLVGTDMGNRHVQSVKEGLAERETALRNRKCPRCGGELIARNGKYGAFYGCSNYPKCRFTQTIRK